MNVLDYEKKKYDYFQAEINKFKLELLDNREIALDMPIETDNGFNVEREKLIEDIDEKLSVLGRHSEDPYFAKLAFTDKEDKSDFVGYIGRLSIGQISDPDDNKIVDWRAPISDLYYNGRIGECSYQALGNTFTVDLKLKRQIKIKNHTVESVYDLDDQISNDEFLVPYLTQSADNRLKNIVATIQQEQNEIIRHTPFGNIFVQGVAGSGKTTVALHRLSYIIYNYKKRIFPADILILSPNEIFLNYISNILVDLDADKANSCSINTLIHNLVGDIKLTTKHYQYDKLKKLRVSTDYLTFKNSKEFANVIEKFIADYIRSITYKPLVVKGIKLLDADDVYYFFQGQEQTKTISRVIDDGCKRMAIALSTNTKYLEIARNNVNTSGKDATTRCKILDLMELGNYGYIKQCFKPKLNVHKIYESFVKNIEKYTDYSDVNNLKKCTLLNIKNRLLTYDDFAPIFYILSRCEDLDYYQKMKCVFIDEAQDISELMFLAFKNLFKYASFSIFGDIAQGIYSYQSITNWQDVINEFKDSRMMYLNRSYRTSVEIMIDANKDLVRLGLEPANNVVRHGDQVEYVSNNDVECISKYLKTLNEKYNSTAIICKDDDELETASKKLSSLELVILDENNSFYGEQKNILMTVQTAKGLEFDSVIIYDRSNYTDNEIDIKKLYVAKTRALHKLIICGNK